MKTILANKLKGIVRHGRVLDAQEELISYGYDATPGFRALPDVVVMPATVEEVSAIMKFANEEGIPVVPRGAGTNLSGGCVPVKGGIVLLSTKLKGILKLDVENLTAVLEPGVITADFHSAVESEGLFYPPDPGSLSVTTMGGTVAENAGGLRGLKYGVTKDYVIGLEVVLASGEVVKTGGETVKNVTGYDLTKLFTGSEGTLGFITKIITRLLPLPEARRSMMATFSRLDDAAEAITAIIGGKVVPATLEIMDNTTIRMVEEYAKVGLPTDAEAILLIEVDGIPEVVEREARTVMDVCKKSRAMQIAVATSPEERDKVWSARRSALSALARFSPTTILEDATVPRSKIREMIRAIGGVAEKYSVKIGTFGHAGDGNLHPTILTDDRNAEEMARVEKAIEAIFDAALSLGGTLSGEHGIGIAKARFLKKEIGKEGVNLHRAIKRSLDPKGILNPAKVVGEVDEDAS